MRRKARPGRQEIIDALVELLAERDIDDIPVKLIVSRAGVSRSTFYYNFHGIGDVVDCLIEQFTRSYRRFFGFAEDGLAHAPLGGTTDMVEATEEYVAFFFEHRKEFLAVRKSGRYHEFESRYVSEMADWAMAFDQRFKEPDGTIVEFAPDQLEYLLVAMGHFVLAYLGVWADRGFDLAPDELSGLMLRQMRLMGTREMVYRPIRDMTE